MPAMPIYKLILIICEVIASVALIVVVSLQSGKESGLGAIAGKSDSYLSKSKFGSLDKVLASHISSDDKAYRISEEEIENLISDRESFLISTKIVFKENHPKFICILEQKGLTDWEIGYCCLFTLGLKGKEVGEFIQKKRHYIISSEIRKKLGLGEHDTNIGIWLRTLLSETENL